MAQKKQNPGAFKILFTIKMFKFGRDLCDIGASVNLMQYDVFHKIVLGKPQPTTMRLLMAIKPSRNLWG